MPEEEGGIGTYTHHACNQSIDKTYYCTGRGSRGRGRGRGEGRGRGHRRGGRGGRGRGRRRGARGGMIIVVYFAIDNTYNSIAGTQGRGRGRGRWWGRGIYNNYEDCAILLVVFCFLQE